MEKSWVRKVLVLGIIMLFVGTITVSIPLSANTSTKSVFSDSTRGSGDCDLIINATYNPQPVQMGHYVYFYVNIHDRSGNYQALTVDVHVVSDLPLNFTDTYGWVQDSAYGDFRVMWPNTLDPYSITISAIPKEGYVETNWTDNNITFSNLTAAVTANAFLFGTFYNSTQNNETYTLSVKNLFYFKFEDTSFGSFTNRQINVTKSDTLSFIGTHFIVGLFLCKFQQ